MHIVVCAKQVLDPDGVNAYAFWGRLEVGESGRAFSVGDVVQQIINAYDEQALEAALRLRDAGLECQITVVTVGAEEAGTILRRCVAMGADDAIHVLDPDHGAADGFRTARILAGLIRELDGVELVLCGRQGSDFDQGTVPAVLAEQLEAALVTMAAGVEAEDGSMLVTRATPNGAETVRAQLPAVVSVSNELGLARYPSSRRMMQARRQPPAQRQASEFVQDSGPLAVELVELSVPDVQGQCEIVDGASAAEKAAKLIATLRESGLLGAPSA